MKRLWLKWLHVIGLCDGPLHASWGKGDCEFCRREVMAAIRREREILERFCESMKEGHL